MFTMDTRSSLPLSSHAANGYVGLPSWPERQALHQRHIWIITGPAGCGKSTVAAYLAQELSIPYIEGDDYHPPANIQKMEHGHPLTDADRWDWLIQLRDAAVAHLSPPSSPVQSAQSTASSTDSASPGSTPNSTPAHTSVVVACSALKKKYRDVIRVAAYKDHGVAVHFVYLHVSREVLLARVGARQGHYMKRAMVASQLESLEEPDREELGVDVLVIECVREPITTVQALVLQRVRNLLALDHHPL